jgi:hypothetical protein
MTHLTPRDKGLLAISAVMVVAFSVAAYTLGAITGPKHVFYDGEGNTIPYAAVDSLVRAQFVQESKEGKDTISKYFN